MKEFNLQYITAKSKVLIDDDTIKVNIGPLVKKEFATKDLQYFYHFETEDYHTLYITYTDRNGKTKKIQIYSEFLPGDLSDLIDYLKKNFENKGLNHLSESEAFAMMRITNPRKWVPIVVFLSINIVFCLIFYPMLAHYSDGGFEEITIEDVIDGKELGTRNVSIEGYLLDAGLEETTTTTRRGSSTTTVSNFVPMVPDSWEEGEPVKGRLEFGDMTYEEYDQVLLNDQFLGVIRNIWWEGIDQDNLNFFTSEYGLTFEDEVTLIEITNKKRNDGFIIWVVGGVVIFTLLLVIIIARRGRKNR